MKNTEYWDNLYSWYYKNRGLAFIPYAHSYIKRSHHKKRPKDLQRQAWLEYSGLLRDKAKRKLPYRHPRPDVRRMSTKHYRHFCKQLLKQGKWESISSTWKPYFCSYENMWWP